MSRLIGPGSTIGILGAGQLGRMLALVARRMGYRVIVYGGDRTSPCGQVADKCFDAAFDDDETLKKFALLTDVVTYEFENVPAAAAAAISSQRPLCPNSDLLAAAQNRLKEKTALRTIGITTAEFAPVHSADDLANAVASIGKGILKSNTDGYDGKGQWATPADADASKLWTSTGLNEAIYEGFVDFDYELSVVAGRYADGTCSFYAPSVNHHSNHILDVSVSGSPLVTPEIEKAAQDIAQAILEHFEVVGVLCVEFFLRPDGSLVVNEIAPRPHNSGHLTIEAFNCSQFELQLRTICNLPARPLHRTKPNAAMVNLLGQHLPDTWDLPPAQFETSCSSLHLYGKTEAKTDRKMGHITCLAESAQLAENAAIKARNNLTGSASR